MSVEVMILSFSSKLSLMIESGSVAGLTPRSHPGFQFFQLLASPPCFFKRAGTQPVTQRYDIMRYTLLFNIVYNI